MSRFFPLTLPHCTDFLINRSYAGKLVGPLSPSHSNSSPSPPPTPLPSSSSCAPSTTGCSSWSLPPAEELWQELAHTQVKPCRRPPRYQLLKTGRSLAILTSLEVMFPGAKPQAVASSRQHNGTLGNKKNTKFPSCLQITTLSTASCTIQPVWTSFQHFTFNEF